ncbi:MAG: [LysW]-aminoadipate semialdehyde transaminase [Phycisphaerae bacterium]|nr:[LysW]-aminoadipate semialdehyde transaminase [Phycisphaerae bacterium]
MITTTGEHLGPRGIVALKGEYMIPCVYHFYRDPPQIVRGQGAHLFDHQGRRYLDCYSGVTVMNAGHCNAKINAAAIEQINTLQHTCTIYLTEPIVRLAERLAAAMPGGLRRSFFACTGSEATEGALLLARLHTRRPLVVALRDGLHGRTRWAMNATGIEMWRTDPLPDPDIRFVAMGDVGGLRELFAAEGERIAAVIAEPIHGNGGVVVPPPGFFAAVRAECDAAGALWIADEVQTGMNRTGKFLAVEHEGVLPDIVCLAKALGNGFPISAFVTSDAIAAGYTRPGASTLGGNPVSAAAALATLEYHERNGLGARAAEFGGTLRDRLGELQARHEIIRDVRGRGLMIGVELNPEKVEKVDLVHFSSAADFVLERMKDAGFLIGKTGVGRNVLTFMPPLVVEWSELADAADALDRVLSEL